MKILYLPKTYPENLHNKKKENKKNILLRIRNHLYGFIYEIKYALHFPPIDAFFEASLNEAGDVSRLSYKSFNSDSAEKFDALVVHLRSAPGKLRGDSEKLKAIANSVSCKKILFINSDEAQTMIGNDVIDCYDIVIKREPYNELNRYKISDHNRLKIRPTMLSCMYFKHSKYRKINTIKYKNLLRSDDKKISSDIFFIGKATEKRFEAWDALSKVGEYRLSGGLLARKGYHVDETLLTQPLSQPQYIRAIQSARISLAIDGHGEFTFRHLEVWAAGGFLISNASLRDIQIPLSIEEGKHFVCYDDTNDLIRKVKYYLQNPDLCDSIAKAGQEMFWREYDVKAHGRDIQNWLLGNPPDI